MTRGHNLQLLVSRCQLIDWIVWLSFCTCKTMPKKRARATSNESNTQSTESNVKKIKKEKKIIPKAKSSTPAYIQAKLDNSLVAAHAPTDRRKKPKPGEMGNAAREVRVPDDILEESDSKILSQRFILLVQERYRAHKQSQELPFYLARPKEMFAAVVLDKDQNSPAVAEHKKRHQEKELRQWINSGPSAAHLPNEVHRVAGLNARDSDEDEDEDEDELIDLSHAENSLKRAEEKERRKRQDSTNSEPDKKEPTKVVDEEDISGDEDYAKDYYASDDDEGGGNEDNNN